MNTRLYLLLAITFFSCNKPTTRLNPNFRISKDFVITQLNQIVQAESIIFDGTKTVLQDDTTNQLTVHLINIKNLPADSSLYFAIGNHVVQTLKRLLVDTNQFNTYPIFFMEHHNGAKKPLWYKDYMVNNR